MLPEAAASLAMDTPPFRLQQVGELPRAPAGIPLRELIKALYQLDRVP